MGEKVRQMMRSQLKNARKKEALPGAQVDYYFYPAPCVSHDLSLSLVDLYPLFVCILCEFMRKNNRSKGIKFQLRCNVFLKKFALETNKIVKVDIWFPANTQTVLNSSSLLDHLNHALQDIEQHFDPFVERCLGWVVKRVSQFCLMVNVFKLFTCGCKKSTLPECLRARCSYI